MNEQEYKPGRSRVQAFNLFAGVIMPAISITVEATTHICAEVFFDPIPTTWHLILVVFVPLAQFHVWFAIRRGVAPRPFLTGLVNAITIGISLFYSVVYLPLVPLAALTLVVGLGLLPFAPLLSLIASIVMRFQLQRVAACNSQGSLGTAAPGLVLGLAATALLIGVIELPASLTRYGLQLATSESVETRAYAIRFLRTWGSKDHLLRACYERSGRATDLAGYLFSLQDPVTTSEAKQIYYRVTGETFDTTLSPTRMGGRFIPRETVNFDANHGGTKIGSKLEGLSLSSSRLDASVDADGGVGYMEWTLSFQNDSAIQREARTEVQLPPGGVVSRLTLWVNGEEREAAFAGRNKVREAYQQVAVLQRRDPVLVTTAGRDRILVQCFPVPPQGEMKIRFGVTLPLVLSDVAYAQFLFPHFINRNFRIPDDLRHAFWIESKSPMRSASDALTTVWETGNSAAMNGQLQDDDLSKPETSITLSRGRVSEVWSKDPFEPSGFIIQQSIQERVPTHLNRIVLVVDTSAAMSDWVSQVIQAMRSQSPDLDLKLVLADAVGKHEIVRTNLSDGPLSVVSRLSAARFEGGADNLPALVQAWDLAAAKPGNNAIVWVHSPQLLELQPVEELRQRWERRPYGPTLYSVQITSGSDQIEKKLDGIDEVKSVARTSALEADLHILFARLTGKVKTYEWVRSSKKFEAQLDLRNAGQTSDHLARLWANDEVTRILAARDESLNDAATKLAVRYQLVTPVSGAVVLETAEQYRAAGLQPVDAGSVPTIPEPEMVILLAVAGLFLSWLVYRKYRTSRSGCPV
jgi:hypothetical protein